jgi:hypothetical protein
MDDEKLFEIIDNKLDRIFSILDDIRKANGEKNIKIAKLETQVKVIWTGLGIVGVTVIGIIIKWLVNLI